MKLIKERLPQHIGFIMDGNGRWATRRGMPRKFGHRKGADALERMVNYCFDIGIKYVSCFAFSTENWKRPKEEIDYIFNLLREFLKKQNAKGEKAQNEEIKSRNIKVRFMGDLNELPSDLAEELNKYSIDTQDCDAYVLNIAMNYGGRADVVHACNQLIARGARSVTEEDISNCLYSGGLPDPDFIIRTAGDIRLSNFMLYQCAYSELYFTKIYWPDFAPKHLDKALKDYMKRNRKFGQLKGTDNL